jgi:hypothetical protein
MSGEGKRQVVGLSRWRRSGRAVGGLGQDEAERQAVLHFQHVDAAVADLGQAAEQFYHLGFDHEVVQAAFGPGGVLTAELDLADDAGGRAEDRLAAADEEPLDAAEVELLQALDQPAAPG